MIWKNGFTGVSPLNKSRYIFLMMIVLVMLPLLTGLRYTQAGYILNFLFADVMFYRWCIPRIIEDKLEERRRRYRDGE